MPVHRMLKDSGLPADQAEALVRAFDLAMKSLQLVDRDDPFTEMVAAKVIAIGKSGLRDPAAICDAVLKEFKS
jgi:hypothetical protein